MGKVKSPLNKERLNCFTPEVMLVTFVIELVLAVYAFIRYGKNRFGKVTVLILVVLAAFQLAEHQICGNSHALVWSRLGYIAISLLPVLGLYLISLVSHKTHFLKLGLLFAAGFIAYFFTVSDSITSTICSGNYIIFNISENVYAIYGLYYFGFLILAIWEAIEKMREIKGNSKSKKTLFWIIVGYLSFMMPMGVAYAVIPASRIAVTSVMCGFALIFAFILVFKVLPAHNKDN